MPLKIMQENVVIGITPLDAHQMIQEDPRTIFIDVRSSMEFLFVGHPKGAINIPWIDEPDWVVNPNFAAEVRKLVLGGVHCDGERCLAIILICRSGVRSVDAGEILLESGFRKVYSVLGGFEGDLNENHQRSAVNGWRFDRLPWEQC